MAKEQESESKQTTTRSGEKQCDNSKSRAISDLIESIGHGELPLSCTLSLSRRIMESSIGRKNRSTEVMNSFGSGSTGKYSSVLHKKVERYFRNIHDGMSVSASTLTNEKELLVREKMSKVESLYHKLRLLEGQELASNYLTLLTCLAGTKSNTSSSNGGYVNGQNFVQDAGVSNNQVLTTHERTIASLAPSTILSKKHVELALRHEEMTLLRECLHILQNIDGEHIRFYRNLGDSNTRAFTLDKGRDRMTHYEGVRIRPGLLPFQLDVKTRFDHKSSRLLGSGAMDAIRICCEAGWLYSRIQFYIDTVLSSSKEQTTDEKIGIVARALASTLSKELHSYHIFLSSLEQQLSSQTPMELTARRLLTQMRMPITKLRTMAILTDGNTPDLSGGELLAALHLHSMHGDVRHKELVQSILYSAAIPWYDLLYDWTMFGILSARSAKKDRTREDFFIVEDEQVEDQHLWHDRYILCERQIPYLPGSSSGREIIDIELAKEALVIGKGINYIRKCLNDIEWNMDLKSMIPNYDKMKLSEMQIDGNGDDTKIIKKLLGYHFDPGYNQLQNDVRRKGAMVFARTQLQKTISIASCQVHSHILTSLFEQHHLLQHLQGLKDFLFLGQGDFISALIDGLHAVFDSRKGVNGIYMHNLMGVLHDALKMTNAQYHPRYILDRVHVKLLPKNEGGRRQLWAYDDDLSDETIVNAGFEEEELDGWDIFSIGYEIDAPLMAVVHRVAMSKYSRVFTLLFRLKRIEMMLNNTWRQRTALNHALQIMSSKYGEMGTNRASSSHESETFSTMKLMLRRVSMTRQSMLHFVSNLQSYFMFEVLESGWKQLVGKVKSAKTLDEIIFAHNHYLREIEIKSLLGEASRQEDDKLHNLGRQLRRVLVISYRFCKVHEGIFSELLQSIDKSAEKLRWAENRTNAGMWGFENADSDGDGTKFYHLFDTSKLNDVEMISDEFDDSLRKLLSMLNGTINDVASPEAEIQSSSETPTYQTTETDKGTDRLPINYDALRFLAFRLDFSEYYSRIISGGE